MKGEVTYGLWLVIGAVVIGSLLIFIFREQATAILNRIFDVFNNWVDSALTP